MAKSKKIEFTVSDQEDGARLDNLIVQHSKIEAFSREFAQKLIAQEMVKISGKVIKKPGLRLREGVNVVVIIPEARDLSLTPKKIPLDIVYEDEDLLVINKQAGISVHPAAHETGEGPDNLVQALLYHLKGKLSGIGGVKRPGIVHRLDKNTSGLLIIAKNDLAHQKLADDFKNRKIQKNYLALVVGRLKTPEGRIEMEIGRSRSNRKKMAIGGIASRNAITEYKVIKEYLGPDKHYYSLVEIDLKTGRTHQIRVHFKAVGHFLVGDEVYGSEKFNKLFEKKFGLKRQFLHSFKIAFSHPRTQKKVELKIALPDDLKNVLNGLKEVI